MQQYKDYGYEDEGPRYAHRYLWKPLVDFIGPPENKKVLDLGCGNGWLSRLLIQKGVDLFGIDASASGIQLAKKYYPERFFVHDLSKGDLPVVLANQKFNTVISTEVIEHLYDPKSLLKLSKKILLRNGGGELILSTPYHGYWKNLALALSGKMDDHFTVLWDGGHIKFWSRKTLTTALEEQDFEVIAFRGAGRLPYFWKSMLIKARV